MQRLHNRALRALNKVDREKRLSYRVPAAQAPTSSERKTLERQTRETQRDAEPKPPIQQVPHRLAHFDFLRSYRDEGCLGAMRCE
jgi:hypothetical protein